MKPFACLVALLGMVAALPSCRAAGNPPATNHVPASGQLLRQVFEAHQSRNVLVVPGLLDQVLTQVRREGDTHGEALVLHACAEVFRKLGMAPTADEHEAKGRALLTASTNTALVSRAWSGMGWCYSKIGQTAKATDAYARSLKLAEAAADPVALGMVHLLLAKHTRDTLGQRQTSLRHLHEAIRHWQRSGDARGEAAAHFHMSAYYSVAYQLDLGLESVNLAKALLQAAPPRSPGKGLIEQFREIYTDDQELGVRISQARASHLRRLGQPEAAETEYSDGVKLARQAGLNYPLALILSDLAEMQRGQGKLEQAEQTFIETLAVAKKSGSRPSEGAALRGLAQIANSRKDAVKAREFATQALALARETGALHDPSLLLQIIAHSHSLEGNSAAALTNHQAAAEVNERVRESFGDLTEAKLIFQAEQVYSYGAVVECLFKLNRREETFAWVERAKGRTLLDLLANGKVNVTRGLRPEDRQQEDRLRQRLQQVHSTLTAEGLELAPNPARLASLRTQVAKAESELRTFTEKLLVQQPDLAVRRAARTITLDALAATLPADTALISYWYPFPGYVDVHMVTVTDGQAVQRVHRRARPAEEITELIQDFTESCADPKRSFQSKARALHQFLLDPVLGDLVGKRRLIICPDGALWGVPFQALLGKGSTGEQFLGERFEITYAYSATTALAALQAAASPQRAKPTAPLLVVANPDFGGAARFGTNPVNRAIGAEARALGAEARAIGAEARAVTSRDGGITALPGTQREADAIRAAYPEARLLTGAQAQEATVKTEAGKYRYLHFATHGLFSESAPLTSSVVLAQPSDAAKEDGFLTAREIFEQNWAADLVVFSACDTGRGKRLKGEGVVGLTWAAFVAGAPSQVVSQWAVNDASTAKLMAAFYQQLKAGKGRGAALQAASLELMKDGAHGHPYYWAPFILLGDWRN